MREGDPQPPAQQPTQGGSGASASGDQQTGQGHDGAPPGPLVAALALEPTSQLGPGETAPPLPQASQPPAANKGQ
eukprot:7218694-Alexandrium_andersonii.AAC.1